MKITVKVPPKIKTTTTGECGSLVCNLNKDEYIFTFFSFGGVGYSHYKTFKNGTECNSDTMPQVVEKAICERAESLGWF